MLVYYLILIPTVITLTQPTTCNQVYSLHSVTAISLKALSNPRETCRMDESIWDPLPVCQQDNRFSCECSTECWSLLSSIDVIDWVSLETEQCTSIDELALRAKLAGWASEECGTSLHCGIVLPILPQQVVISNLSCNTITLHGSLSLIILLSPSEAISSENALPASMLGAILHSREHLLAIFLRAHLSAVRLTRRLPSPSRSPTTTSTVSTTTTVFTTVAFITTSARTTTIRLKEVKEDEMKPSPFSSTLGLVLAVIAFISAVLFLVIYAIWGRIDWKRLAEGRWKRRVYRKVPDMVFRPADETINTGPTPHSTSFHSTTELIRY